MALRVWQTHLNWRLKSSQWTRTFGILNSLAKDKPLPPRRVVPEHEIEESFLKGSGPGGQKIPTKNKTNSAVQLKHLPTGLVVKCQGTRSRDQNRKDARRLLGEKLDEIELGDMSRTSLKAQIASKKKASKRKKSLRKYRALDEAKADVEGRSEDGEEDSHDGKGVGAEGLHGQGTSSSGITDGAKTQREEYSLLSTNADESDGREECTSQNR